MYILPQQKKICKEKKRKKRFVFAELVSSAAHCMFAVSQVPLRPLPSGNKCEDRAGLFLCGGGSPGSETGSGWAGSLSVSLGSQRGTRQECGPPTSPAFTAYDLEIDRWLPAPDCPLLMVGDSDSPPQCGGRNHWDVRKSQ